MRWCTITYWEYNHPYDQQFNAIEHTCLIHQESSIKNGFCLKNFQLKTENREILKTRQLIKKGLRLFINSEGSNYYIWLFNDCECSLYWICPGLYDLNSLNETNFKPKQIKTGESSIIYNYNQVKNNDLKKNNNIMHEAHIVNVSFKKYWGLGSKRRSVEYCPCWFNISINLNYF